MSGLAYIYYIYDHYDLFVTTLVRVSSVVFPGGCPSELSCCTEYGYCRAEVTPAQGLRD